MFLCSLLFIGIADCMSQKKPLDMEAYKLWRRVEGQQMSEDGKWVTYRFVFIDQEGHDRLYYSEGLEPIGKRLYGSAAVCPTPVP